MIRSTRRTRETALVAATCCALAALTVSTSAHAQDGATDDRQGAFMANMKIGPAIGIGEFSGYTAFGLELEAGYAVIANHGYITFSPNFAFGDLTLITLPVGFQYEFELPVDKLYAYGRFGLGMAIVTEGGDPVFHMGPHAGAKYQITEMFHVGAEPLSFPIYFNENGVALQYRFLAYGGIDL
jgi:hypothetical protein